MKLMIKIVAVLALVSIVGCGQQDDKPVKEPVKEADTGVFKTQLETLDQAKQVEQVIQDGAEQQRQKIEEQTQ